MLYETKTELFYLKKCEGFDFVPHIHHHIEIFLCGGGVWDVCCNFQTKRMSEGDIMISFPNDIHSYHCSEDGKGMLLIFDPSLLSGFQSRFEKNRYENFLIGDNQRLIEIIQAVCEEYEGERCLEILEGYLLVIMGNLLRRLPVAQKSETLSSVRFSEILKYLSENYTKKVSLYTLSKRFGVSEGHLSRCFSQRFSCSFVKYLHLLRVEHAKKLLKHSGLSILQIAYESGFSDQRSFNRVFKELENCTPKEFRKLTERK